MDNRIESDLRKYVELEVIFGTYDNEIAQWKSRYHDMDALVDSMRAEVLKLKETIRVYDKRIVALGCIAMEDTKQFCAGTKNCGELYKADNTALRAEALADLDTLVEYTIPDGLKYLGRVRRILISDIESLQKSELRVISEHCDHVITREEVQQVLDALNMLVNKGQDPVSGEMFYQSEADYNGDQAISLLQSKLEKD